MYKYVTVYADQFKTYRILFIDNVYIYIYIYLYIYMYVSVYTFGLEKPGPSQLSTARHDVLELPGREWHWIEEP